MKTTNTCFRFIICLSFLLFGAKTGLYAQVQCNECQNPSPTPSYCYDTSYHPVCGCDQHTYINFCQWSQAGLNCFTDRICEEIAIPQLYPNPVGLDATPLHYRIYLKQQEDAFVYIYDEYGRARYYRFFQNVLDDAETLDPTNFPHGVYIMIAVANGHFAYKKFIKY